MYRKPPMKLHSFRIPQTLIAELDQVCEVHEIERSAFVRNCLADAISRYGQKAGIRVNRDAWIAA